jgi:hypothetical protein
MRRLLPEQGCISLRDTTKKEEKYRMLSPAESQVDIELASSQPERIRDSQARRLGERALRPATKIAEL